MHVLLVPPVDSVDHPAVRHLTTAVDTALSGSVVIGAFLRPGSAGLLAAQPTAGRRGYADAMGFPRMSAG
ncbi:hypothetical protein GCM10022232_42070 [Streptomyces plumbiresistens]|uniref:Uncharacterized protein n=1 Tax=Streptomyces plumbiresistens TaxID=511811 RepID=A0ABP7RN27_9ACTN